MFGGPGGPGVLLRSAVPVIVVGVGTAGIEGLGGAGVQEPSQRAKPQTDRPTLSSRDRGEVHVGGGPPRLHQAGMRSWGCLLPY